MNKIDFIEQKKINFMHFMEQSFANHPQLHEYITLLKSVPAAAFISYIQQYIMNRDIDDYLTEMMTKYEVDVYKVDDQVRYKLKRYLTMFVDVAAE